MSRWGLGRRPRGRHALGAAVTEIPSTPVRFAAAVPRAALNAQPSAPGEPVRDAGPAPYAVLADERDAGPAHSDPSDAELEWLGLLSHKPDRGAPTVGHVGPGQTQPDPPDPGGSPPALDPLDAAVPLALLPAAPEYTDLLDASMLWTDPDTRWQVALEAVLPDPLPDRREAVVPARPEFHVVDQPIASTASAPPAPVQAGVVPEQPGARVSLGFRDGTTTSLAADSVQALALEELASLLTRRD